MNAEGRKVLVGACSGGAEWAEQFDTPAQAWEACERPDWMLWALGRTGKSDLKTDRLFACWCVRFTPLKDGRVVWDLLKDERYRKAVEVAELYVCDKASIEQLQEACHSAHIAYADAAYAYAAAAAATYAVADAAYAYAAAAAATYAEAEAYADAVYAARKAQADQLRKMYGNPFTAIKEGSAK